MAVFDFSRVLDYERLPIDAQDVVTRARVVVLAQPAGEHRTQLSAVGTSGQRVDYLPSPIVVEHSAPQHSMFGAERTFALPGGIDPFFPPTYPSIPNPVAVGFADANNVRDGQPDTYAALTTGTGHRHLRFRMIVHPQIVAGYRLVMRLESGPATTVAGVPPVYTLMTLSRETTAPGGYGYAAASAMHELKNSDQPAESFSYLPPAQHNRLDADPTPVIRHSDDVGVYVDAAADVSVLRIYEFYPLVLDTALVQAIARAQIRLPANNPRRVVVRGYLPPGDRVHTITGWPGADYTGIVARQTYKDMTTIIDFEQPGAPPGVPHELVEAERVRLNRTQEIVRSAAYPNLIGRR